MIKIFKKSYLFIGLIIFIWVARDIDFIQFKNIISAINPFYYALAAILWLPTVFSKAYRWNKIMDVQKIHYSAKDAFLMYGSSSLLGLATPGKIGDFSRIVYLRKDNHSLGRAFLGNFLDRLFDLFFVVVFGFVSFFFLPFPPSISVDYYAFIKWSGIIAALLSVAGILFYSTKRDAFCDFIFEIAQDIREFKIKNILFIFFASAIGWFLYFFLIYLIAMSVNLHQTIGFFYMSFAAAIALLAGFIPITVLGIGTREAIFIFLLTPLGVSKEMIVIFSLLIMVNYLALFAVYLYCWIKKPIISPNS